MSAPRRIRLRLEQLETRDCPSAPQIGVSAMVLPGHNVQLSGMLNDTEPANATVTFSGAATGTTTTNSYGMYSLTTGDAVLGTVYAVAVDQQGQSSNTAQATIAVTPPSLTLMVAYGTQTTVTLSGQLTDIDQGSQTITISGVASGSVVTASNGSYSLTTQATALGTVQASTTDSWGQASNTAQVTLTSNPPQITNFAAIEEPGNMWTFQGQVTDQSPQGLTVTFSGLPSLDGQTATVGANGWFYLTITLGSGESGIACAQTTDCWGQASNVAQSSVT